MILKNSQRHIFTIAVVPVCFDPRLPAHQRSFHCFQRRLHFCHKTRCVLAVGVKEFPNPDCNCDRPVVVAIVEAILREKEKQGKGVVFAW